MALPLPFQPHSDVHAGLARSSVHDGKTGRPRLRDTLDPQRCRALPKPSRTPPALDLEARGDRADTASVGSSGSGSREYSATGRSAGRPRLPRLGELARRGVCPGHEEVNRSLECLSGEIGFIGPRARRIAGLDRANRILSIFEPAGASNSDPPSERTSRFGPETGSRDGRLPKQARTPPNDNSSRGVRCLESQFRIS